MNDWPGPHIVQPDCDCLHCSVYAAALKAKMASSYTKTYSQKLVDGGVIDALLGQTCYPDEPDADSR